MDVGRADYKRHDCIVDPVGGVRVERVQSDQKGQCPKLEDNYCSDTAVENFAEVADDEKSDNPEHCRRNAKQVSLGGGVAEMTERES